MQGGPGGPGVSGGGSREFQGGSLGPSVQQQFACKAKFLNLRCAPLCARPLFWYTPSQPHQPKPQPVLFPYKTSFFTDGSADPSNLPNVRLSSSSTIRYYGNGVGGHSGITPGPLHRELRPLLCCKSSDYVVRLTYTLTTVLLFYMQIILFATAFDQHTGNLKRMVIYGLSLPLN